jgi:3'-phosphoadenosine 5'-phosphosulfate sulfotransferase (PAPS reductase)/FAD synthetase
MMKYTKEDLKKMQSWPLERKIQVTQTRIIEWYQHWEGKVYVSFSGGKDSTVLLDLARRIYPDIEAVFVDTGLEYPEIREFVKSKDNVSWIYPIKYDKEKKEWVRTNFKEVVKTCGYPVISKRVSRQIHDVKKHGENCWAWGCFNGRKKGFLNMEKWKPLIEAPFKISDQCCDVMKKKPAKEYGKKTGKKAIIGTRVDESQQRRATWLKQGCNAFDNKNPISNPISFWTEQDILQYLKQFNIPYASIYGDIVENEHGKLKTTGISRTGCMFCMFGVHLEKEPNRFQRMAVTHPQLYDYCINKLGCGKVLDYIGVDYSPLPK